MQKLSRELMEFAGLMLNKLFKKRNQGFTGWDMMEIGEIQSKMYDHIRKGDWVDVANLALFAWHWQKKNSMKK